MEYEEHRGGVLIERTYILPWSKVPNGTTAEKVVTSMQNFSEDIKKEFPQMAELDDMDTSMFREGFPAITEEYRNGKIVSVTTLTKVDKQSFAFGPSKDSVEESLMSSTTGGDKTRRQPRSSFGSSDMAPSRDRYQKRNHVTESEQPGPPGTLPPGAADALKHLQQLFDENQ